MTNEEINIAIAEYRNWRNIKEIDYQPFGTDPYIDGPHQMLVGIHPESDSDSDEYEAIPNYCKDLNEMHGVEEVLTLDQKMQYVRHIANPWDTDFAGPNGNYWKMWLCAHVTASQRAKAFLKTIGKWVE